MELKTYQADALKNLTEFLRLLNAGNSICAAFEKFWLGRDVNAPKYRENISGVPQVCLKVPTGGGKTFMAAASLKMIFDELPARNKIVVWLVPSDAILTQTYKNLSDATHAYHRRLVEDFRDQVAVYTKDQLLAGENFSPAEVAEQVSILVLSYDSFRATNKDGRKAYRQNGQLNQFVAHFRDDEEFLHGADESSLIQVIRHYNPIVIVDESHHAATDLSVDMLTNFNPRFILELTATPKVTSNIIAYVPATALKDADMIKLPVVVYNGCHTQAEVITDAITFRNRLEDYGSRAGVRPIVLFQAEAQGKGDRATFDRIKAELIATHAIPAEQIAIKTADINDLRGVDLMAKNCPVRYVITVNALKEGWDCPFAYILASLANRTSAVDVEQILGRILRRPFTKNFPDEVLNQSYVLTSSADFRQTLDKIVDGLNAAGFTERDYRVAESESPPESESPSESESSPESELPAAQNFTAAQDVVAEMEAQALQAAADYQAATENFRDDRAPEERERMTEFFMRDKFKADAREILLPQFFRREESGGLFDAVTDVAIGKENLCENFSLADKDIDISFENLAYEIAAVDVENGEDVPRYKFLSDIAAKEFLEHFDKSAPDAQIRQCAAKLAAAVDKDNAPASQKIFAYVARIVATFDRERRREAVLHTDVYAKKIADKINALKTEHAKKNFLAQVDARKIFAKPSFSLPEKISPVQFQKSWSNSLYVAEEKVNDWEYRLAAALTRVENVLWWHRNRAKIGFCLNGFINHYPDFIVRMKNGVVLLVEFKGDDRDNSDSKNKLALGKIWESKAGSDKFGYFMVFESERLDGALSMDNFVARLKEL